MGLKHPQLEELLRGLLVDEARKAWQSKGVARPNISQIAVTTGLNRKDVTQRLRSADDMLASTALSSVNRTFALWLQLAHESPALGSLPITAAAAQPSFEALAREASRGDIHHRAALDEMLRLGMVVERDGQVELMARGIAPSRDLQTLLAFLGDNTRDHLLASVSNALGQSPQFVERAVYADGMTREECEKIHALVRDRWDHLHQELITTLSAAVDKSAGQGSQRMRIGIYAYYEELDAAQGAAPERRSP